MTSRIGRQGWSSWSLRYAIVGPRGRINDVQVQWSQLIQRVQAAVDAGMDSASAQAQELAAQWMGLLQAFHGGDQGLRDSLYRMQADNAAQIEQQHGGPSPAQLDFIKAANAARR